MDGWCDVENSLVNTLIEAGIASISLAITLAIVVHFSGATKIAMKIYTRSQDTLDTSVKNVETLAASTQGISEILKSSQLTQSETLGVIQTMIERLTNVTRGVEHVLQTQAASNDAIARVITNQATETQHIEDAMQRIVLANETALRTQVDRMIAAIKDNSDGLHTLIEDKVRTILLEYAKLGGKLGEDITTSKEIEKE
ncbi:MAG: hypothetical protein HC892_00175 [Saprospiraceae bacterium]|nr:hypothetical protein [Saprospiraceae bacterium]